jgi:ferredoxin-NADP reductase
MTSLAFGSETAITIGETLGRSSAIKVTDEPPPAPHPGKWQTATVVAIRPETAKAKTFTLALAKPMSYLAGQHLIVRLTAPDGYTASRSYSIASPPADSDEIEITVERLENGEVSSFLHDVVVVGDQLEVRGPIGGWFVWRGEESALLVGGGSGVVPLMAMLRLARRSGRTDVAHLVVSAKDPGSLYYSNELRGTDCTLVFTRRAPSGSFRAPGRINASDLPSIARRADTSFVCGSAGFCDAATAILTGAGISTERIRVERFGPTN